MSHIPPLDPNVAARKGFRESEERLKRFWKAVDVVEGQGGQKGMWSVTLDGRTPKTPAHAQLALPTEAAARLVADEWAAQGEFIDPGTMPATRLASTAIDRVSQAREPVADEIAAFAGWARTAMAAIGIGLAFNALFNAMEPAWAPKAIATVFILLAIFLVIMAERRACAVSARLDTHAGKDLSKMNLRVIAVGIGFGAACLIAGIWLLV